MTQIKTIRIHYEEGEIFYHLYDREGNFHIKTSKPISIYNLKIKRFGFCFRDTIDVTLELEEPIESTEIKETKE